MAAKRQWARIPAQLLLDTRLTTAQRLVGAIAVLHAGPTQQLFCRPERIARETKLSPRTVRRALRQLEKCGWLTVSGTEPRLSWTLSQPPQP